MIHSHRKRCSGLLKIIHSCEQGGALRSKIILQPDSRPLKGGNPCLQGRDQPFSDVAMVTLHLLVEGAYG